MRMLLDIHVITTSNRYIKLPEYVCSGSTFKKYITISSEINHADFFEKYNKKWKKN